jgi:RNA polymerase sigma factor (sigma-70 family)
MTAAPIPSTASTPIALAAPPPHGDLVHRHLRTVWRYLRTLGASADVADDLAQESFVVALRRGACELPAAATGAFLRRTARFLFLHHLRQRHRDAAHLGGFADAVDELFAREDAAGGSDEHLERLRACVASLPPRSRLAIERCYGIAADSDATRAAVAAALGLQPNGLKTLLQRIRQALRDCLERRNR